MATLDLVAAGLHGGLTLPVSDPNRSVTTLSEVLFACVASWYMCEDRYGYLLSVGPRFSNGGLVGRVNRGK